MSTKIPRDRPADDKVEEIEVTPEMEEAGAKVLADLLDAPPYTARIAARRVFRSMTVARGG